VDRTTLLLLNEELLMELDMLPSNAKEALDKVVVRKISKTLGLDLNFMYSTADQLGYFASLSEGKKEYRLEINPLSYANVWAVSLEYFPFGYRSSRSRSETLGYGKGATVNEALNNLEKP